MSWEQFWFVLIGCVLAMWACRVIPLFLLKGRELPPRLAQALGFIPPAASPQAKVTACSSAIPTSKNRSGNIRRNRDSPVPSAIAAVMAAIFGSLLASSHRTLPNTSV